MSTAGVILKGFAEAIKHNEDRIKRLSGADKQAYRLAADMGRNNILKHFQDEQGPGTAWAGLKSREGKPLQDTGRLRGSIKSKTSGNSGVVYTNVEYAKYHEFGKGRMNRSFMWLDDETVKKIVNFFGKWFWHGKS